MHFSKKDLLTIPNILTYFRFILVPVFIILYVKLDTFPQNLWAVGCVVISALTDIADGRIARHTGQITDIGKILDPVADKMMEFAMMFCIAFRYPRVIILFMVFAVKEIVSLCFSGYLFKHNKTIGGAMWCGKLCTVILYGVLLIFLVVPNGLIGKPLQMIMITVSLIAMIIAFVVYMHAYINLLRELKREQPGPEPK